MPCIRIIINLLCTLLTILALAAAAPAETYRWTDAAGNIHFSDNPASVPAGMRSKISVGEDITLESLEVRESVAEGRKLATELQNRDRLQKQERDRAQRAQEQQNRRTQANDEAPKKQAAARQTAGNRHVFRRSGAA